VSGFFFTFDFDEGEITVDVVVEWCRIEDDDDEDDDDEGLVLLLFRRAFVTVAISAVGIERIVEFLPREVERDE